MLEHSDGLIAMAILGSARGSRARFGGLAENRGYSQSDSETASPRRAKAFGVASTRGRMRSNENDNAVTFVRPCAAVNP
jgi:hypothetical protein